MQRDLFEDTNFALQVGNYAVTGESGSNLIRLSLSGTVLCNMTTEQAKALAEAIRTVVVCVKHS